jgi:hypothetical protein
MTPRPTAAPAAIATTTLALRARAVATTAAAPSRPGYPSTSLPTHIRARWGHFRPSRWGQCKPSFSTGHHVAQKAIATIEHDLKIAQLAPQN